MAAAKTERLLNLLIMLLVQRGYVSKERIRELLYDDASDEAFGKMFERDKEELRSLGVPIEVGTIDPLFGDEPGYRISPDEFALPPISLTADEAAVVGLATTVWEHARLADATTEAVRKLTASGVDVDVAALDLVQPRLAAEEPSFDVFLEAVQQRRVVEFDYRSARDADATTRHLQPWSVVRFSGRWYVVGHDVDRNGSRIFRLSRVAGEARPVGAPGAYVVPDDVDTREVARSLRPAPVAATAVLLARTGTCHALRRGASVEGEVAGPDTRTGWDRLVIADGRFDLPGEILAHGADVYVLAPPELRAEVVSRLRAAAGVAEVAS